MIRLINQIKSYGIYLINILKKKYFSIPKNNDLGATICHNKTTVHLPFTKSCKSAFKVKSTKKETKKQNPTKKINYALARSNDSFLLFKKLEQSFWEGLWTPLELNPSHPLPWKDDIETLEEISMKHKLSNFNLDIKINIYE